MNNLSAELRAVLLLIRAAVDQTPVTIGSAELNWNQILQYLEHHQVTEMAYVGSQQLTDPQNIPPEILATLRKKYQKNSAKEAHQHIALESMRTAFNAAGIDFAPLKGAILKYEYPKPQMRQMCDLDVLFRPEQIDKVRPILESLGFEFDHYGDVDDGYFLPPFLGVEAHKKLFKQPQEYVDFFEDIWDRLIPAEGSQHEYRMSWEDFYLYILAHIAKHFSVLGGTGFRSLTDFHVLRKMTTDLLDRQQLDQQLEQLNLTRFDRTLCRLDDGLFRDTPALSDELWDVFEYMAAAGIYGTASNDMLSELASRQQDTQSQKAAKASFLWHRLFPNRELMQHLYPQVARHPWMLPFAWVYRIVHTLLFSHKKVAQRLNTLNTSDVLAEKRLRISQLTGL